MNPNTEIPSSLRADVAEKQQATTGRGCVPVSVAPRLGVEIHQDRQALDRKERALSILLRHPEFEEYLELQRLLAPSPAGGY